MKKIIFLLVVHLVFLSAGYGQIDNTPGSSTLPYGGEVTICDMDFQQSISIATIEVFYGVPTVWQSDSIHIYVDGNIVFADAIAQFPSILEFNPIGGIMGSHLLIKIKAACPSDNQATLPVVCTINATYTTSTSVNHAGWYPYPVVQFWQGYQQGMNWVIPVTFIANVDFVEFYNSTFDTTLFSTGEIIFNSNQVINGNVSFQYDVWNTCWVTLKDTQIQVIMVLQEVGDTTSFGGQPVLDTLENITIQNPVEDKFRFFLGGVERELPKGYILEFFNYQGVEVLLEDRKSLPASLSAGIYFLKINNNGKSRYVKVVKK